YRRRLSYENWAPRKPVRLCLCRAWRPARRPGADWWRYQGRTSLAGGPDCLPAEPKRNLPDWRNAKAAGARYQAGGSGLPAACALHSAATGVEQGAHRLHGQQTAFLHIAQRRLATENGIAIGQADP